MEKTLSNKVFESLGQVSMCWSEIPKGVFKSSEAEKIGLELMEAITSEIRAEKIKLLKGLYYTIEHNQDVNNALNDIDDIISELREEGKGDKV